MADLEHVKDKAEVIKERKIQVEDRLQQKQQFKEDVDEIIDNGNLVRDLTHYDAENHELYQKPQSLTRKQTNQTYKQEFELKIDKMNQRL